MPKRNELGTRRCQVCRVRLPLSAFDLQDLTYQCRGCSQVWIGCVPALTRLRKHCDGDARWLARALGLTQGAVQDLLDAPEVLMTPPLSRRIRTVYERARDLSKHVRATVPGLERIALAEGWAEVWRQA